MTVDKDRFKIIKDGGKEYILASKVPDYAKEYFNTSFGIPSYRTIRYYVTEGVIPRPEKKGRETYFELQLMMYIIELLKKLHPLNPPLSRTRNIILNAKRQNAWNSLFKVIDAASNKPDIILKGKDKLFVLLEMKNSKEINLAELDKFWNK